MHTSQQVIIYLVGVREEFPTDCGEPTALCASEQYVKTELEAVKSAIVVGDPTFQGKNKAMLSRLQHRRTYMLVLKI